MSTLAVEARIAAPPESAAAAGRAGASPPAARGAVAAHRRLPGGAGPAGGGDALRPRGGAARHARHSLLLAVAHRPRHQAQGAAVAAHWSSAAICRTACSAAASRCSRSSSPAIRTSSTCGWWCSITWACRRTICSARRTWRRAVATAVEAELARRIAHRDVDAVLTTEKAAIQDEVRAAAQKRVNDYNVGVLLSTVNIESVDPPPEAADAFRDVASARADSARIVNEVAGLRQRHHPQGARRGAADARNPPRATGRRRSTRPGATRRASRRWRPSTPRRSR